MELLSECPAAGSSSGAPRIRAPSSSQAALEAAVKILREEREGLSISQFASRLYQYRDSQNRNGEFKMEVQRCGTTTWLSRAEVKNLGIHPDLRSDTVSYRPPRPSAHQRLELPAQPRPSADDRRHSAPPAQPPPSANPRTAPPRNDLRSELTRPSSSSSSASSQPPFSLPRVDSHLVPYSSKQRDYQSALSNTEVKVVYCCGKKGTGKTVFAVTEALRWLSDQAAKPLPQGTT